MINSLHIRPIQKAYRFQRLMCTLVMLWFAVGNASPNSASTAANVPIRMGRIVVDDVKNELQIYCDILDNTWTEGFRKRTTLVQFNGYYKENEFKKITIKKRTKISDTQYVYHVQLPLKYALSTPEPYIFECQISDHGKQYHVRKEIQLGSIVTSFDLRPYITFETAEIIGIAIAILIVLSFILIVIRPLYTAYRFKQNHIWKYKDIAHENTEHLDTFTFETIEEKDEIVTMNEEILLLSSWKVLNTIPESKPALAHAHFFPEQSEGTFFSPKSGPLVKINAVWYAILGIGIGWGVHLLTVSAMLDLLTSMVSLSGNLARGVEILISDAYLGLCVGVWYSLGLAFATQMQQTTNLNVGRVLGQISLRTLCVFLGFMIQALWLTYMPLDQFTSALISWLCISLGFAISVTFRFRIRYEVMMAFCITLCSYGSYQVLTMKSLLTYIDTHITTLICLLGISLASLFMIPKAKKKQKEDSEEAQGIPSIPVKITEEKKTQAIEETEEQSYTVHSTLNS